MNYMNKRPASLNGCGHERFAVVGAIQTFPHGAAAAAGPFEIAGREINSSAVAINAIVRKLPVVASRTREFHMNYITLEYIGHLILAVGYLVMVVHHVNHILG
jgi:hypothetical protein